MYFDIEAVMEHLQISTIEQSWISLYLTLETMMDRVRIETDYRHYYLINSLYNNIFYFRFISRLNNGESFSESYTLLHFAG